MVKSRLPARLPVSLFLPRDALARTRVLVVGDVMLDRYWFGDVHRISPEAPVPVVQLRESEDRLGGAANVARNVVSLGARACLLGFIGDDEAGSCVRRLLRLATIDDALCVRDGERTVVKLRVLGGRQQLLRVDFDHTCGSHSGGFEVADLDRLVRAHQLVVISDYAKGTLADPQSVIRVARRHRRPVLVDPKGGDFSRYAHATIITPNCAELARIVGQWHSEQELADKAQALRRSLSLRALLLTRSAEGLSLFDDAGALHCPAQAKEVFDVCGAGDTVIAVLAGLLASGVSCGQAVAIANHAAGIAVGKLGTATVDYDELFGGTSALATPLMS